MFEFCIFLAVVGISLPWLLRVFVGARWAIAGGAAIPLLNATLAFAGLRTLDAATADGSDALVLWIGVMVFAVPLVFQVPSLLLFMIAYRMELLGRVPSSAVKRWRKRRA